MNYHLVTILFVLLPLITQGCSTMTVNSENPVQKIPVGPGPEDMVLDTLHGSPRLVISCSARRESQKPYGEMVALNLQTGLKQELKRTNEPAGLIFQPHGIYLDRDLLYVISHEQEPGYHPILIYRLHGDSLEFKELIHTTAQHSPNALVSGPGGTIYFVNDSGKRGSTAEKVLKLKRANVVRLEKDSSGIWHAMVVAEKLGYPAGINRTGNRLYVGDAILNRIHVFEITGHGLTKTDTFKKLRGNDNIRFHNQQLITTGHIRPFQFIKHTKDPANLSPVAVFLVNPQTGSFTTLYHTDGSSISAGSTAIIFRNQLYISQVFDPFILKVQLGE